MQHGGEAFGEQPGVAGDESDLGEEEDDRYGLVLKERLMKGLGEELAEDRRPYAVRGDGHDIEEREERQAKVAARTLAEEEAERKERQDEIRRPGLSGEEEQREIEGDTAEGDGAKSGGAAGPAQPYSRQENKDGKKHEAEDAVFHEAGRGGADDAFEHVGEIAGGARGVLEVERKQNGHVAQDEIAVAGDQDYKESSEPAQASSGNQKKSRRKEERKKFDDDDAQGDEGAGERGSMLREKQKGETEQNGKHGVVLSIDGDELHAHGAGEIEDGGDADRRFGEEETGDAHPDGQKETLGHDGEEDDDERRVPEEKETAVEDGVERSVAGGVIEIGQQMVESGAGRKDVEGGDVAAHGQMQDEKRCDVEAEAAEDEGGVDGAVEGALRAAMDPGAGGGDVAEDREERTERGTRLQTL